MSTKNDVTLQISLAPTDLLHAEHILPHQLRQWAGQVDEVLLTLDTRLHRNHGPYFEVWKEKLPKIQLLIESHCTRYSNVFYKEVDYSPEVATHISHHFFGGGPVPNKDYKGTPIYAYFFGLYAAKYDYVFHLDSDMMFGGGSQIWINEAVRLLSERPDVLVCNPLPGPPTSDGTLKRQEPDGRFILNAPILEPYSSLAFRFSSLSSRIFFIQRRRFSSQIQQLHACRPALRYVLKSVILRDNPPWEFTEVMLTRAMIQHSLFRIDFLGQEPGMWSLHPPYRSELFYKTLPEIIQRIETGDVPEAQRGDFDLNDSIIDWTDARTASSKNAWWRQFGRKYLSAWKTC